MTLIKSTAGYFGVIDSYASVPPEQQLHQRMQFQNRGCTVEWNAVECSCGISQTPFQNKHALVWKLQNLKEISCISFTGVKVGSALVSLWWFKVNSATSPYYDGCQVYPLSLNVESSNYNTTLPRRFGNPPLRVISSLLLLHLMQQSSLTSGTHKLQWRIALALKLMIFGYHTNLGGNKMQKVYLGLYKGPYWWFLHCISH